MAGVKKLWHDPVWSKVIATAIIAVAVFLSQYFLHWMDSAFQATKRFYIVTLQNTLVPNWLLGLMSVCTIAVIGVLILVTWQNYKSVPATLDWKKDYKQDIFWGILWRWKYDYKGQLEDIYSFCPDCDYQVYAKNISGFRAVDHIAFECENCGCQLANFQESYYVLENKLIRFIQQKIRNNNWIKEKTN